MHASLNVSLGLPITVFWVLLVTNAFNLIDGLDGLAAGSALFSTLIIFVVSLWRQTPLVSILSIALAGSILGFLRYNFHPASIFLGDSGSLPIGFLLSALALAGSQKATTMLAVAIPVVSFGLPILDVMLSVLRRFVSGKPIFGADDDHIHHKLLKQGLSHRNAVLVLYAVAAGFGLLSLILLHGEVMIGVVLLILAVGVSWGIRRLRYLEFYELGATSRRLRHRKRIMANNLHLRRVIESRFKNAANFSQICGVLEASLGAIGFCGVAFDVPSGLRKNLDMSPLRVDHQGRLAHYWSEPIRFGSEWELKLPLTLTNQEKMGTFSILCPDSSNPVWVDLYLINTEFRAAVAEAVGRAVGASGVIHQTQERPRAVIPAKIHASKAKSEKVPDLA